ncbi:putative inorganic phosphate cotransporter isoform X2 [Parasteatoda tepidariorum]|uniref:putative inorganic phosphate cotransporter isoform X2 n=1 Tax=Parasteatoda tepidariorum TaxID=114398 RepID=UPI00077FDD27|nr:putative inorganic phosphate cotransporter isoform X2 [Parasteatoda tepidariorum]
MLEWERYYFPRRYVLVLLGFLGMFSIYAMRVNISMTIVAMVNQTAVAFPNNSHSETKECLNLDYDNELVQSNGFKGEQYNWDTTTQTTILGSYYYGYVLTQLPGGIIAEKFGAKWVFGCGILTTAIISLLIPLTASFGSLALTCIRVIQGLADGITIPAINVAISRWSPKSERSRVSTVIFSGAQIGTVIALPISGLLSVTDVLGGWPSVFYVFGSMTCIWFVFWAFLIYEKPSVHPGISREELLFIELNNDEQDKKRPANLWKNIFTSIPMWALILGHFGHNYGFIVLLLELPTYLSTVLNFDLKSNGFLSALPFVVQAAGAWIASFIADYLRHSNKMSITAIRKMMNSIGEFGPAICLIGVTFAGCQPSLTISLLCLALALNGCVYSGYNITHVDMCPEFAGTLYAITNTIANITGILGPMSVGVFTASGATLANWSNVFYTAAAVYLFCGTIFAVFGSAELQTWGSAENKSEKEASSEKNSDEVEIKTSL